MNRIALALLLSVIWVAPKVGDAAPITLTTTESQQYLLIGLGGVNEGEDITGKNVPGIGQAVNVNNFELGANKTTVPSDPSIHNSGGGPTLLNTVPDIPPLIHPVAQGIEGNGNIAITHPDGVFNLQDVGVYADPAVGIQTTAGSSADAGTQNSFFNDPNLFPNTFDPGGPSATEVNPGDADQSTRIDQPTAAGVTHNFDFTALMSELFDPVTGAMATIAGATADTTLELIAGNNPSGAGKINFELEDVSQPGFFTTTNSNETGFSPSGEAIDTFRLTLTNPGLTVIDIVTGGGLDILLENHNFVIDALFDTSKVIFRVPDDANFLVTNGNILAGETIGENNVLFYSDKPDNNQHFKFNNTILNGVAFWTLGREGGEINVQNGQGSTQFIADKIALDDVRFGRWSFQGAPVVTTNNDPLPEPSGIVLLATASFVLIGYRRGRRRTSKAA